MTIAKRMIRLAWHPIHHFARTAITIPAIGGSITGNTFSNMVFKAPRYTIFYIGNI